MSRSGGDALAAAAKRHRRFDLARLLGSAVGSQALLSAAGLAVGLLLIRRTDDLQYASYILAANAIVLAVSLQTAFFGPVLATRAARLDAAGRAALVGGLADARRRLVAAALAGAGVLVAAFWWAGRLDAHAALAAAVAGVAALAMLRREFFRGALFAYRRALPVLWADFAYAALLVAGVALATLTPAPALAALAALAVAALVGSQRLAAALARHAPWQRRRQPGLLREIAPLAAWSTAGAAVHWSLSQGYLYLVAALLDVQAVAAIAATRLLLMPLNLLSTGIGALMLPLAAAWQHEHGAARVLRRLAGFAALLAAVALAYFALLWWARDDVFTHLLHRHFAQGDLLLALWGALVLVMVVRDQLAYALAAQGRFRAMTLLTSACAAVSLAASIAGVQRLGAPGALAGMLVGEVLSLAGIVTLAWPRRPRAQMAARPA